ncbi:hypothetical protein FACS1894172_17210 [Spirochaetia bacterium]|nr:hypothetical protein FACS1894164_17740 [Spirochaetia bacterium]GHU35408.1 hypothetical protein FACS1894172_17210 [Spirochaetia bacterium]
MAIKVASRSNNDIEGIIREINQPRIKVVIYFFSIEFESSAPQKALKHAFPDAVCAGMSSVGGYSPAGALDKGIVAMSFSEDEVTKAFVFSSTDVKANPLQAARSIIENINRTISRQIDDPGKYLGIIFVDGLCLAEIIMKELTLNKSLNFPIVGGAAADELAFVKTLVGAEENLFANGLVVLVLKMRIPFICGHYVHFSPLPESFIVTRSDSDRRILWELDGLPAAEVYAKAIGLSSVNQLSTDMFAKHPLGVVFGNDIYVRDVSSVVDDGKGLVFFCDIQAGTQVHLLKHGDMLAHTRKLLQDTEQYLPNMEGAILFNCVFRLLELQELGKNEEYCKLFNPLQFIGCNTFGEELFMHHNQTLTAVFFGR